MLITDQILDKILKDYPHDTTGIAVIAKRKSKRTRFIAQINRMWDSLPEAIKNDTRQQNLILTTHLGNFRGKLAELYTYFVLKKTVPSGQIIIEPRINSLTTPDKPLTPDFYTISEHNSFIVETFCLGQDSNERNYQRNLEALKNEIKDLESNFIISTVGNPVPNKVGTFAGIGAILKAYLDGLTYDGDSNRTHIVEHDGASIYFHVSEKTSSALPTLFGHLGDVTSGDPQIDLLTTRLERKVDQYRFPFVACCVADSIGTADLFTLAETMLGHEQFVVPINMSAGATNFTDTKLQYDMTGFWGIKNPALSSHLGVQGVLLIRPEHPFGDGDVQLHVHFMENPHLKTGIRNAFQNVPDVFLSPIEGDRMDIPGLVVTP
jgi:hypothetical protein